MLPTFTTHIYQLIPHLEEKKIYVAVSGGIDSMVLLNLCHQASLSPTALHCNFNLRGEDSKADEDFVKSYCESLNIDFKSTHFQTSEIAKKHRLSIQECARNLRYNWFQTFLENDKNAVLLTGHHQNDSIETFFINLLRGTGLKGLTGIKVSREQIHRPLLAFRKND